MIIILLVMAVIAVGIFVLVAGKNKRGKQQSGTAHVIPAEPKQTRAPGLD
jgi:flagellar basal body-associated protein FliL